MHKYLVAFGFLVFMSSPFTFAESQKEIVSSPNILFIIADDMGKDAMKGFSEGSIKPNTPHINKLKGDGLNFTNFWTNPTCSPTRASIITGKYGYRTGVKRPGDKLDQSEKTLHQYIKDETNNQYATALIGKWHLSGSDRMFNPERFGIDYFAGITSGGTRSYTQWRLMEHGSTSFQNNYITEKLTDLSIAWIKKQTQPWFLWLAYNAPHTPFHAPPAHMHSQGKLGAYERRDDPFPYYMAAIEAMDFQIGRLLAQLTDEQRENTLIIFIGDNGSPRQVAQKPYASYQVKGSLYQGGINMPFFMTGKGVERVGEDHSLVNNTDLFTTIAQVAGSSTDRLHDSKSILPLLSKKVSHREYVYIDSDDFNMKGCAIRDQQYKLIALNSGTEKLYDLNVDPYEKENLISSEKQLSKKEEAALLRLRNAIQEIRK